MERRAVELRILGEVNRVLATCPAELDELTGLYGADPSRLAVVPCGVDPEVFRPVDRKEARAALGLGDGPTVVYVGRIVPRKGVDTLVEAFALLPRLLGARLVIVGGEPEASPEAMRLSTLARKLGVAGRVLFAGSRPQGDLHHYYGAADAAVSVPHYEPFGMTPLEAMACATPVVGSRVGGIKTSVADGETGYLVPPKDPEALAGRLRACSPTRPCATAWAGPPGGGSRNTTPGSASPAWPPPPSRKSCGRRRRNAPPG